jgi:hypothetical protein
MRLSGAKTQVSFFDRCDVVASHVRWHDAVHCLPAILTSGLIDPTRLWSIIEWLI